MDNELRPILLTIEEAQALRDLHARERRAQTVLRATVMRNEATLLEAQQDSVDMLQELAHRHGFDPLLSWTLEGRELRAETKPAEQRGAARPRLAGNPG